MIGKSRSKKASEVKFRVELDRHEIPEMVSRCDNHPIPPLLALFKIQDPSAHCSADASSRRQREVALEAEGLRRFFCNSSMIVTVLAKKEDISYIHPHAGEICIEKRKTSHQLLQSTIPRIAPG